jgi:hypothetical protein
MHFFSTLYLVLLTASISMKAKDVFNSIMRIKYASTRRGLIPIQAVSNGIYGYHEEGMQLERKARTKSSRKGDSCELTVLRSILSVRSF